jgi:hypothetical protein
LILTVLALPLLGLIGCLDVPLGDPENSKVDDRLIGAWEEADGGEILVATRFDNRAYLVTVYKSDANSVRPTGEMYKAWITPLGDQQFITLAPLTPTVAFGGEKPTYPVAKWKLDGDTLTARGVDPEFAKPATTPEALAKLLLENLNNPKAFVDKDNIYRRATAARMQQIVQASTKPS